MGKGSSLQSVYGPTRGLRAMPRQHSNTIGFIGTVSEVSDDGGWGLILAHTVRRNDNEPLGMRIDEDIFVHTRSGKHGRIELRDGMKVLFLLGPNERHPGKLRAFQVQEL